MRHRDRTLRTPFHKCFIIYPLDTLTPASCPRFFLLRGYTGSAEFVTGRPASTLLCSGWGVLGTFRAGLRGDLRTGILPPGNHDDVLPLLDEAEPAGLLLDDRRVAAQILDRAL